MTALSRASHLAALGVLLSACAVAPPASETAVTPAASATAPMVTSSGLVIGTLSYHYVDVGSRAPALMVHFERIDAPANPQDYALPVDVDPATRSGVFTGALPAGVYAFREAASAGRRYPVGALPMPFEIQAGAVQDAGHYALDPGFSRRPR